MTDSLTDVVMYSHDTYGLGHLTRTRRLAAAVRGAFPEANITILSGSPVVNRFTFPSGTRLVKLPSVVKTGANTYQSRDGHMSFGQIYQLRVHIINQTLLNLSPQLLMVDNVPSGMKGELLHSLLRLKRENRQTRVCLNLRDVLDAPEVIRTNWKQEGAFDLLSHYYDTIHVFGSPEIFDTIEAYNLPSDRTAFLGYVGPSEEEQTSKVPLPPAESGAVRVLVTVGGGGDGVEIIRCVSEMQRGRTDGVPFHFDIVYGPLMNRKDVQGLAKALAEVDGITLHEFVENIPAWMAASDVVLSMGGYNTLCEVMTSARRSIVVPRTVPRREQIIRARALERHGLVHVLDPDELNPHTLKRMLCDVLNRDSVIARHWCPPVTGIVNLKNRLIEQYESACLTARVSGELPMERLAS